MDDRVAHDLARLMNEQRALRRLALLVARGVSPDEVFRVVGSEVSMLFGSAASALVQFEDERPATVLVDTGGPHGIGAPIALDPGCVVDTVRKTGRPARFDTEEPPAADQGTVAGMRGVRSAVASPIVVDGRPWGAIVVASPYGPLPPAAEDQLMPFSELVATAIANAGEREALARFAGEQAALRRLAELVARESSSSSLVFRAVTEEARRVLDTDAVALFRFDSDGMATLVAGSHTSRAPPSSQTRFALDAESVIAEVARSGRAARADHRADALASVLGVRSIVATPIRVELRLWGTLLAGTSRCEPLPSDTEDRVEQFARPIATAIASGEARAELSRLAAEQATLRRVAEIVAREARPTRVFAAANDAIGELLGEETRMIRYDGEDRAIVVAAYPDDPDDVLPVGACLPLGGNNVISRVFRTGEPARMDDYGDASGPIADAVRPSGIRSVVAAPIIVGGRPWGAVLVATFNADPVPAETEWRLLEFTELMATAIANADGLDQLRASRARLVTAHDAARRRVVRDLHDGAQQRLVHTIITLKLAREALGEIPGEGTSLLAEALDHAEQAIAELRELAHGILPGVLTHGGLRAGVDALVERFELPVRVDVPVERFGPEIEATAYFIVAEALTNVAKHARASAAEVRAYARDGMLHVEVRDDGVGGAHRDGHGLVGLADRATALGGRLEVDSPARGGTVLAATMPLDGGAGPGLAEHAARDRSGSGLLPG